MTMPDFTVSLNRIVVDGQSLNLLPGTLLAWPNVMQDDILVPTSNMSNGSTSWTSLAKRATQTIFPLAALAQNSILILGVGGQTDLIDEGDSGATIYSELVAYSTAAISAGFDAVVGLTIPPSTSYTGGQNTARTNANSAILADASNAFDATVDVTVAPLDDASDTDYYSDGLHYTALGASTCSGLVVPAILSLLI